MEQAHSCSGSRTFFSFISVQDERSLSDVVITKIHQIEGVEETDTHIVADSQSCRVLLTDRIGLDRRPLTD